MGLTRQFALDFSLFQSPIQASIRRDGTSFLDEAEHEEEARHETNELQDVRPDFSPETSGLWRTDAKNDCLERVAVDRRTCRRGGRLGLSFLFPIPRYEKHH
jgi:hypothetical protein